MTQASSITLEIWTNIRSYYITIVPKSEVDLKTRVESLCKKGFWTDHQHGGVIQFIPAHVILSVDVHINET